MADGTPLRVPPSVQTSLLNEHPCPTCAGSGQRPNPETGSEERCRVCQGAGNVPYDPDDHSEFPF